MLLVDKINKNSNNLNILRFVAAVMVIVCHAFAITLNQEDFYWQFNNGQCNLGAVAVAFFFFISGIFVTKSLNTTPNLKLFMKKRCFRIFPQLWCVILLTVLLIGPFFTSLGLRDYFLSFHTWKYFLNMFLLPIHNLPGVFERNIYQTVNGPLWTLPIEFLCYLGLAVIAFLAKYIKKEDCKDVEKVLHCIALILSLMLYILFACIIHQEFMATVVRPIVFFWEGAVYFDCREKIHLNTKRAILLLLVLILACKTPFYNFVMIAIFPYIVISMCMGIKDSSRSKKIFKISYEMYLIGWPIQQIVFEVMHYKQSPYLNMIISIPLDVLFAYLIYTITEIVTNKEVRFK